MLEYWTFLDWLTLHSSTHGLKFVRRPWSARPAGFPEHTIYCDVSYQDKVYFGLGHHANPRMGHVIAAAEALERVGMAYLKLHSSNGCAVHMDAERAKTAALNELVERDAFLCHFYTGHALAEIPPALTERVRSMKEWAHQHGWTLAAGVLSNALGLPAIMVCVNGLQRPRKLGIFTGLGFALDWEQALEKALAECWRFADAELGAPVETQTLTLAEFLALEPKGVKEHIRLSADPDYGSAVWDRLFAKSAPTIDVRFDVRATTTFRVFPMSEIFPGCPLYFAQAENPQLVPVGFGGKWRLSLEHERYRKFSATGATIDWPHCMG